MAVAGMVAHALYAAAGVDGGRWTAVLAVMIACTGTGALYGLLRPGGYVAIARTALALGVVLLVGHLAGGIAFSVWTAWLAFFAVTFPLSMEPIPAAVAPAAVAAAYFFGTTLGVDGLGAVDAAMRAAAFAGAGAACHLIGHAVLDLRGQRDRLAGRLSEAESVIDAAVATSPGGMAVLDLDGGIESANDALTRLLGREAGSIDGTEWPVLLHPAEASSMRQHVASLATGSTSTVEVDTRFMRVDGAVVHAVVGLAAVVDRTGSPSRVFAHVTDVSDRVHSERRLRQSESHYRHLFELSPVPLWEVDLTGVGEIPAGGAVDTTRLLQASQVRNVNEAARDLFSAVDEDEFAAGFASGMLGADHGSAFADLVRAVSRGILRGERPVVATDFAGGTHQGMLRMLVPRVEDEVDLTGVVVAFVDSTEQVEVEETLVRLEERLHTVMSGAPIVVFATDSDGVYTLSEGTALARIGQTPGRSVGRSAFEVHRDHPAVIRNIRRALAGEAFTGLDEIGDLLFETRYSPVLEGGTVTAVFGVSYDITDRVRTAERLRELVRSKDDFVATVSHELRTPLTAVVGFAHELRDGLTALASDDVAAYVGLIEEQATEVADLVEDLLVASRSDQGEVPISLSATDLWEQVDMVLTARPLTANVLEEGRGEAAKVFADAIRVRQILRNLLINADRYGGPNVTIAVDSNEHQRVLQVRDDGAGIPKAHRSFIFEPYHRAHRAEGRTESVGLGLTVSRHLAGLMGGTLEYTYERGQSIFSLTLPAA